MNIYIFLSQHHIYVMLRQKTEVLMNDSYGCH